MVCRAYSLLSQGKWRSLSPLVEVSLITPKDFLEELPLHSPYPSTLFPSFSPSPYPSIFTLFLSLAILLRPSLIPPHTLPLTTLRHPPTAGSHLALHLEGSPHSMCCHAFPLSPAVWIILCLHPLSGNVGFMGHHPRLNGPSSLHAPSLFDHLDMSSPRSSLQAHFSPSLGSIYHEIPPKHILLDVIAGVGEGWLLKIPWEALPVTRTFVKERLALAAFSSCSCSTLTGSSLWCSNIDSGSSPPSESQSLTVEKSMILGCHC